MKARVPSMGSSTQRKRASPPERSLPGLVGDVERLAEIGADDGAGNVSERVREVEQGVEARGAAVRHSIAALSG